MRIPVELATTITTAALLAPYRQIDPMPTDRFVEWLRKRDIGIGDWKTLHHLWRIGVLQAVAVRDTSWDGKLIPGFKTIPTERLAFVGEDQRGRVYADLGTVVSDSSPLKVNHRVPTQLRYALLWHPFQLWQLHTLNHCLGMRDSWGIVLGGPGYMLKQRRAWWEMAARKVREDAEDSLQETFLRILALLMHAEPLVHSSIFPRLTLDAFNRDIDHYYEWRNEQAGYGLLDASGLTLSERV